MSAIRTNAAARMLGVSPNTVRSWETRFGYPTPRRTEGGHRQFELAEIEALKNALDETREISSAVAIARQRGTGPPTDWRLRSAFGHFSSEKADLLLEESLAVRSVERTVESLLLAAVAALSPQAAQSDDDGSARALASHASAAEAVSPEYCFAWRYATGWLAAAQRVAPPAARPEGVLILDATAPLGIDALYVHALELFIRRASLRVLALPVGLQATRLVTALSALKPTAIVLGGSAQSMDTIARLVYTARQSLGDVEILDYRGAVPDTGASTVGRLGDSPSAAVEILGSRLATLAEAASQLAVGRRFVRAASKQQSADASAHVVVLSGDGASVAG
jgi:DNA-binding transcriptional MerR regulator